MRPDAVPAPTIRRLSLYLRQLEAMHREGKQTVSSRELGAGLGLTDAQVRKDLACFGQFGQPGVGYQVVDLIERARRILGTDKTAGLCRITNDTLIRFKKEVARLEKQHKRVRGGETLVRLVEMTTSLKRDEILELTPVALEDIVRRIRIEVLGPEKTFMTENPDTGEKVEVTVNLEEIEVTPPVMGPETSKFALAGLPPLQALSQSL